MPMCYRCFNRAVMTLRDGTQPTCEKCFTLDVKMNLMDLFAPPHAYYLMNDSPGRFGVEGFRTATELKERDVVEFENGHGLRVRARVTQIYDRKHSDGATFVQLERAFSVGAFIKATSYNPLPNWNVLEEEAAEEPDIDLEDFQFLADDMRSAARAIRERTHQTEYGNGRASGMEEAADMIEELLKRERMS